MRSGRPTWQRPPDAPPHLHRALDELKEARAELQAADRDFGGHREAALKGVDASVQIEEACAGAKVTSDGGKPEKGVYNGTPTTRTSTTSWPS